MTETLVRKVRLDNEVWEAMRALPGKSVNDAMRAALLGKRDGAQGNEGPQAWSREIYDAVMETLELVRGLAADLDPDHACGPTETPRTTDVADPRTVLAEARVGVATAETGKRTRNFGDGIEVPMFAEDGSRLTLQMQKAIAQNLHKKRLAAKYVHGSAAQREDIEYEDGAGAP